MSKTVHVAVGVILDTNQRVLLAKRQAGQHLAGLWEFPGGKIEPDESPSAALQRELEEEVGLLALEPEFLFDIAFNYPEKNVCLHIYLVRKYHGEPNGREGQLLEWRDICQLEKSQVPPANAKIIDYLQAQASCSIS